jgi:hypothetical protein
MKKIITSVLFVVATFSMSCSQTPENKKTESIFGPGLEFEVKEHDFGTLEQYGDGTFSFIFTNTGTEPLILSNVRSSCGCTVPEWPREPINAGTSSEILVKYDTKRIGTFSKSISVYSNANEMPVVLRIRGKVEPKTTDAAAAH